MGYYNHLCRLFTHVDMKALGPSSRHIVYKILDVFIAKYRAGEYSDYLVDISSCLCSRLLKAMQSMGDEFLLGLRNLLDGEKDPRNLMLIFQMDRVVCIDFDISKHVEV